MILQGPFSVLITKTSTDGVGVSVGGWLGGILGGKSDEGLRQRDNKGSNNFQGGEKHVTVTWARTRIGRGRRYRPCLPLAINLEGDPSPTIAQFQQVQARQIRRDRGHAPQSVNPSLTHSLTQPRQTGHGGGRSDKALHIVTDGRTKLSECILNTPSIRMLGVI